MSSFPGSNVFCQSGIALSDTGVQWLAGPVNVHGFYVVPPDATPGGLQEINLYDGDPAASGILRFMLPSTYSPVHEMQGAIYCDIPMNGIRFDNGVWLKCEGATVTVPNGALIFYTGAFQTIGSSP